MLSPASLAGLGRPLKERLAKKKIKLAPGKKAELIALLYELFTETEKELDADTVERYLRLVA